MASQLSSGSLRLDNLDDLSNAPSTTALASFLYNKTGSLFYLNTAGTEIKLDDSDAGLPLIGDGGATYIDLTTGSLDVAGGTNITTGLAAVGGVAVATINLDASPSVTSVTASADFSGANVNLSGYLAMGDANISEAEMTFLDGAGTAVVASKAVIATANKDITSLRSVTGTADLYFANANLSG